MATNLTFVITVLFNTGLIGYCNFNIFTVKLYKN